MEGGANGEITQSQNSALWIIPECQVMADSLEETIQIKLDSQKQFRLSSERRGLKGAQKAKSLHILMEKKNKLPQSGDREKMVQEIKGQPKVPWASSGHLK